ncbi:MAG: hypothetical protein BWX48_00774 [Verrucomicrobia bacterium ADurb.Bin006]|nr:MAG: hypothetical protein BWX48_00774 [Verrucomicrobia bacterium ADurb.Bin006]
MLHGVVTTASRVNKFCSVTAFVATFVDCRRVERQR